MSACVIIPARYKSSRFPGKPLVSILGVPMIVRVAELSATAVGRSNVYDATDDERIAKVVEEAGFDALMTGSNAMTGTDRLAEAAQQVSQDIVVNVQGDEPILDPADISRCIAEKEKTPDHVLNGFCWLSPEEDPASTNIPKVAAGHDGRMLYMSRSLVPGSKDAESAPERYMKQVCIYGFDLGQLARYADFGRKGLAEQHEDIEILRFSELGIPVRLFETTPGSLAVDEPDDVARVEAALRRRG